MTDLLALSAGDVAVEVDPLGGEVRSFRVRGRELLFRPPWDPDLSVDRGDDDTAWVTGWAGGWVVLFPNAGPAAEVDGLHHPYHGEAALRPWDVIARSPHGGTLEVSLGGVAARVRRRFMLRSRTLSVRTRVDNVGDVPIRHVAVEHLVLGEGALGAGAEVTLPAGDLVVLDPASSPCPWDRVPEGPAMWFGVVRHADGPARVRSADGGVTVTVGWDAPHLPHLWVWLEHQDNRTSPWNGEVRCLGLEPASTVVGDGLAAAQEAGDEAVLGPGAALMSTVTLTVD